MAFLAVPLKGGTCGVLILPSEGKLAEFPG